MGTWEIKSQITFLVTFLVIGFVTGLLFDIYRRMRNLVSPGPYLTAFGDLCFWGLVTVITFTSLIAVSSGQVRGYVFFGMGLGLLLYLHYISYHTIVCFVSLEIYILRFFRRILALSSRVRNVKILRVVRRILIDAKRIFSKIKKD